MPRPTTLRLAAAVLAGALISASGAYSIEPLALPSLPLALVIGGVSLLATAVIHLVIR